MQKNKSSEAVVPQRMVRPLDFLTKDVRKEIVRNQITKLGVNGDVEGMRDLLARQPELLNKRGNHHRTLLWEAVRRGKMPAVEWLVEQGADVNAVGRYNGESFVLLSPYCAALYYRRAEVAKYLRAHGAQEDIFRAAYLGDREAVARELDAQPDLINAEDPQDDIYYVPLLSFAVAGGKIDMLRYLLERGAVVAPYSLQLLSLAAKDSRKDIFDLLLEHHAQVPPLGECYFSNIYELDIMRYLLEHGASASQRGDNGFTPLIYLCRADKGEQPDKIKLLLEYHAPVNAVGPKGRTALHYASAAGFVDVMTILLDHGADYRLRDQQDETPLALARRYERTAAVNLLEDRGAVE